MNMIKEKGNDQSAADFVANQLPLGKQIKLSNKEIDETLKKHGIAANDRKSMEIRRMLPFTDNMIIPEIDTTAKVRREKSPMMFTKLRTVEEFEAYEFTEKNFRKLEQATIDEVVTKARDNGAGNFLILKLLTILDTILVTAKHYDVYQPIKRRRLMAYVREPKDAVNDLLHFLVEMGVMSYKGRFEDIKCLFCVHRTSARAGSSVINVDFERSKKDKDNSPKKVLTDTLSNDTILEVSKKEGEVLNRGIDHFIGKKDSSESSIINNYKTTQSDEGLEYKSLDSLLNAIAAYDKDQKTSFIREKTSLTKQVKELEGELAELTKRVEMQEEQLSKQSTQIEAFKIAEAQMQKLAAENERLKNAQRVYADNVKDYKEFRKAVKDRVEAVMDHFKTQILEVALENREPQNRDRFVSRTTEISCDISKSILNMLTMNA